MAFCRNCGKEVKDGAKFCAGCGTATGVAADAPIVNNVVTNAPNSTVNVAAARTAASAPAVNRAAGNAPNLGEDLPKNVENHMVKAILSTCLCCLPLGVVSIVYAAKVKPALLAEDEDAAREASKKANFWGNLALIIGGVIYIIQLSLLVVPRFSQASGKAKLASAAQFVTTFTDSRDGKSYKKIEIGSQTWMGENLNYNAANSKCNNCAKYGRLYDRPTALTVCPAGWHLPTDAEWTALEDYVGGSKTAGKKLKSKKGWDENGNGTDEFGFSALPGGRFGSGNGLTRTNFVGSVGYWWSATKDSGCDICNPCRNMSHRGDEVRSGDLVFCDDDDLVSVRCVQD